MQPSDEMVEAASLVLYNRIRGRWGMRPVDSLEGNQSELVANLKGDVREVLAAVYTMVLEEAAKVAGARKQAYQAQVEALKGAAQTMADKGVISGPSFGETWSAAMAQAADEIASAIREMAREA